MSRNNIKLLSTGQLEKLNYKYQFTLDEDSIVVSLKDYHRQTRHPKNQPFHINSKVYVKRKICFNIQAIEFWIKTQEEGMKFSLFDVQQAVNVLTVTYQKVDYESVLHLLKQKSIKIQQI